METDASCGTCNGLFQPLDLEKSFFQGQNCCIIHGHYFHRKLLSYDYSLSHAPPLAPSPTFILHIHVSCSFANLKVCLFEVLEEELLCHDKTMQHQQTRCVC